MKRATLYQVPTLTDWPADCPIFHWFSFSGLDQEAVDLRSYQACKIWLQECSVRRNVGGKLFLRWFPESCMLQVARAAVRHAKELSENYWSKAKKEQSLSWVNPMVRQKKDNQSDERCCPPQQEVKVANSCPLFPTSDLLTLQGRPVYCTSCTS